MTEPTELLDRLWASTVGQCSFDLATQTLRLELTLESSNGRETHFLEFIDVRDLRFVNSIPSPWSYAEATEIHVTHSDGEVAASMMLWSEDAELAVRCKVVVLDGKPIAGRAAA